MPLVDFKTRTQKDVYKFSRFKAIATIADIRQFDVNNECQGRTVRILERRVPDSGSPHQKGSGGCRHRRILKSVQAIWWIKFLQSITFFLFLFEKMLILQLCKNVLKIKIYYYLSLNKLPLIKMLLDRGVV